MIRQVKRLLSIAHDTQNSIEVSCNDDSLPSKANCKDRTMLCPEEIKSICEPFRMDELKYLLPFSQEAKRIQAELYGVIEPRYEDAYAGRYLDS